MIVYRLLLWLKLASVCVYAGGTLAAFVAADLERRRLAVHRIASPGLLGAWVLGYLLTFHVNVGLTELWVLAGLMLSFLAHAALQRSLSHATPTRGDALAVGLGILGTLAFMVFRPTWASVRA